MSAFSTPSIVPKPVGVPINPPCDKCTSAGVLCIMTPNDEVEPQHQRPRTSCDRCHKRKERCPRRAHVQFEAPVQPQQLVFGAAPDMPSSGADQPSVNDGTEAMEVDPELDQAMEMLLNSDFDLSADEQIDWEWLANDNNYLEEEAPPTDDILGGMLGWGRQRDPNIPHVFGQMPRRSADSWRLRFDPDVHVDERRRREDPEFEVYSNLLATGPLAPEPSPSGEGYDWAYTGPPLPPHPPAVLEIPAEFFYVHNLYTHPWHFDKPGARRTESAMQRPDPVYPPNTGMRYFYWRPADDDAQNMETTQERLEIPEEYQFKHFGYLGTVRPVLPVSNPKPDGPIGEHFLAVRWVNWFELHADIVLLKGRYKVEFMFKIIPQTSLPDIYIKINGHLTDTWDLPHEKPNEPLRAIHGINLRAGFPETWENFTTSSICETLSKVGHMRDPDNSKVEVRQAARRCISEDDYETDVWKAWEMDDGGMKLPVQRGAAERPEGVGILEVLRDGTHVRLLAFQGTNKRHSGRGNPPRGRFLFGGVRLTRVGD